jgi:hypothetical protein
MIETAARAEQPEQDAQEERDYQVFCATLAASERGRAFLAEYTRRNRNADTKLLLAAIDKLQALVVANKALPTVESVKTELLTLLGEIGAAQSELDASVVSMKAAKLGELIALVERRIMNIIGSPAATNSLKHDSAQPDTADTQAECTHLAVVPLPDQPELPIPSPITTPPPSIALVHSEVIMAEVAFVEPAPARIDQRVVAEMPKIEPAIAPAFKAALTSKAWPAGPLASIMALSEEERLALFT